jgi:hypothetical protein
LSKTISQTFGEVEGLPIRNTSTIYIVLLWFLAASNRNDLIAPATGTKM